MVNHWVSLASLICLATMSQAVRFCIRNSGVSYIAAGSDMLKSTHTTKEEYGILTGPGFLLVYAFVSLPLGRLVDRLSRLKWFILVNSVGISIATGLNALASQFWGLLYPRCLLALFSAGFEPSSVKLISLSFPSEMRGTAVGIYMAAVYIGSALASSTLVLSSVIGWRMCFIILALVTLSFVAVGFMLINNTVTPRSRRFSIQAEDSDWRSLLRNQTIIFTLIGTFFRYAAGFARGYYEALYFSQQFPGNKQDYSIVNSLALLLTPVNLALAGWFSDRQEMKGKAKYRPILCAVSNFIAVPLLILMYLTDDFGLAMFCLCMVYAVGETYISISVTMMVNVTPTSLRGFRKRYLETSMLLCISFVGGCLSTVSLGFLSTSFEGLQTGLISIVVVGYFLAGLLFALAIRSYPRDLSEFQDEKLVDCNEMK